MEKFIWYSIPGVLVAVAIAIICPCIEPSSVKAVGVVFLIPSVGFIIHQLFRLIFEYTGGFSRKSRTVLNEIIRWAHSVTKNCVITRDEAFLIWEITFYSNCFPESFRDHDRGAWHYIISFWTVASICVPIALVVLWVFIFNLQRIELLAWVFGYAIFALIFREKGFQTYKSLMKQEEALFWSSCKIFEKQLKAVIDHRNKKRA